MASQRRKRSKKKAKRWSPPKDYAPLLWSLFSINFIVGLLFSPVTGLTVLRVEGAPEYDRARIERVAQVMAFRANLTTRSEELRSLVMENSAVESATMRANLFGRGILTIAYKVPVAVIDPQTRLVLSKKGSVFVVPSVLSGLPVLTPPHFEIEKNLSIVGGWRSRDAADLCSFVSDGLPGGPWKIETSKTGFVTLFPAQGASVELGSLDRSEEKVAALAKLLRDDPGLLQKISKLRLYSAHNPVIEK